jgi:hypothetical protein
MIEAVYEFDYVGNSGTYKIEFGFPNCLAARNPNAVDFEV